MPLTTNGSAYDLSINAFQNDLLQKRWKDALYGRYTQLPDGTMKRPLQRKSKRRDLELNTINVHS